MYMNAVYLSARRAARHAHAEIKTLHLASAERLAACIDQPTARADELDHWGRQLDRLNADLEAATEIAKQMRQGRNMSA
ncbi:MAG: hypothetical protein Rhirs2KO_11350 [Rhizobiaceae bacterium]